MRKSSANGLHLSCRGRERHPPIGPESAQVLIGSGLRNFGVHERRFADHPAGDGRRRDCDRAPARAYVRARALCAHRLPHPRGPRPPARVVVHRAHRHAAGRLGAAHPDLHRRDARLCCSARSPSSRRSARTASAPHWSSARSRTRKPRATNWWCWSATSRSTPRCGFKRIPKGQVKMPGPVDPARLLVAELAKGAFAGVKGLIRSDWEEETAP